MVSIDTLYYFYLHPVRSGKQLNEKKTDVLGNTFISVNKKISVSSQFSVNVTYWGGLKPPFPSEVLSQ